MAVDYFHDRFVVQGQDLRIINGGNEYFDVLLEMIRTAKQEFHLQTYIFENDKTGQLILAELVKAAGRGVRIYLLLDDFGSNSFKSIGFQLLTKAGIECRFFGSYRHLRNLYWGRRLHHKVIVADKQKALIGGINISDHYSGLGESAAWMDFALYMEGNRCLELADICKTLWEQKFNIRLRFKATTVEKKIISILQHDYFRRKRHIHDAYLKAIRQSGKEVIIFASYFMPGRRLRLALAKSADKGVRIRIVVQGVSDIYFSKYATQFFYRFCHRHHIELYEWKSTVLHAKVAVVDNSWLTIGSYNLNHLSAYASIELNVAVNDAAMSTAFAAHLTQLIESQTNKVPKNDSGFAFYKQLRNLIAFMVLRWGFRLLYLLLITHKRLFKN
jgi:cardiolipin synthase